MVNAEWAHVSSSLTRFTDLRSLAKLYKRAQVKKRRARTLKPIANYLIKRIADCSLARCTDLRLYHLKSGRWVFNHGASKFHIILSQECLSLQFPENILVALCLRLRASRQRVRPRRRRAILMRRYCLWAYSLVVGGPAIIFWPFAHNTLQWLVVVVVWRKGIVWPIERIHHTLFLSFPLKRYRLTYS